VTLSIVLDSTGRPEWDEVYFVALVDGEFHMTIQPRVGESRQRDDRTYFVCYRNGDAEAAAADDDEAAVARWLEDFYRILPTARGRVLGTRLRRWEHCFSYVAADRAEVLEDVRRPVDRAHFAGDYASSTAGTHGAFAEAARVAREVLAD
jgi:protoporphyrinogen oxidase